MLELNTNDLGTRPSVMIDGHPYTVRQEGAGDSLKINELLRDTKKVQEEFTKSKSKEETSKDLENLVDLQSRMIKIIAARYDDGGDGSKSYDLISKLSNQERMLLERKIFGQNGESLVALDEVEQVLKEETEKKAVDDETKEVPTAN